MALQVDIMFKQQVAANYFRADQFAVYKTRRSAVAIFSLFATKAARDAGAPPLEPDVAKLELSGAEFDAYFGAGVEGAEMIQQQFYAAARALGVSSDYGPVHATNKGHRDLFASAIDV